MKLGTENAALGRLAEAIATLDGAQRLIEVIAALGAAIRESEESADAETMGLIVALRKDYDAVRVLDDGSIAAVGHLITTTAVHLGMNRYGWDSRYCYADPIRALEVLCALKSENDVPEGWVSCRPERMRDDLNRQYTPITPGGTVCAWLASSTEDEAWDKLLQEADPYDSIEELRERGYRVEPLQQSERGQ